MDEKVDYTHISRLDQISYNQCESIWDNENLLQDLDHIEFFKKTKVVTPTEIMFGEYPQEKEHLSHEMLTQLDGYRLNITVEQDLENKDTNLPLKQSDENTTNCSDSLQCDSSSKSITNECNTMHNRENLYEYVQNWYEEYNETVLENIVPVDHVTSDNIEVTSKNDFLCNYCNKQFQNSYHLKRHVKLHNGGLPFKCIYCSKLFVKNVALTRHMKIHTREMPYNCFYCGEGFTQKYKLICHITAIHKNENLCSYNKVCRRTREKVRQHAEMHKMEQMFNCNYCGDHFTSKSTLAAHKLKHADENYYECHDCARRFFKKSTLLHHVRKNHMYRKRYPCYHCDELFTLTSARTDHMKAHLSNTLYKCDCCDRPFARRIELIRHLRTHIGKKPFQCNDCKKWFTEKSYFFKQIKSLANGEPCKCNHCGRLFHSKWNFINHLKGHTHENPFVCHYCKKKYDIITTLAECIKIACNDEDTFEPSSGNEQFEESSIPVGHISNEISTFQFCNNEHLINEIDFANDNKFQQSNYIPQNTSENMYFFTSKKSDFNHTYPDIQNESCGNTDIIHVEVSSCGNDNLPEHCKKLTTHNYIEENVKNTSDTFSKTKFKNPSNGEHVEHITTKHLDSNPIRDTEQVSHCPISPETKNKLCNGGNCQNKKMKKTSHDKNQDSKPQDTKIKKPNRTSRKCWLCRKRFYDRTQLLNHVRKHSREVQYKCNYCEKWFNLESSAFRHVKIHKDEKRRLNIMVRRL